MVIRNTGHMVPHDDPLTGHTLIHGWIQGALAGGPPAYNTTAPGIRPLRAAAATGGGLASVADAEKQLLAELEALAAAAAAA